MQQELDAEWPAREEEEGFCAVTLIWRTCQDSPDQSEYVLPSPDHSSPNSAGKLELAAKWPLLAAGPGPGWWWPHMPVVVSPLSPCCAKHWSLLHSSGGRKWSHHSWHGCLSKIPLLVFSSADRWDLGTCSAPLHPPPPPTAPSSVHPQPHLFQGRWGSFHDRLVS